MANWWDAAPLAEAPKGPAAGANWWEAAPLVQEAVSAKPAKPDAGMVDATVRGAASGLSSGFIDEMAGARNAASERIPEIIATPVGPLPARVIAGGLRTLASKVTGYDPQAEADYQAGRDEMRAGNKAAEENHPVLYTGGQIAGSIAVPVGAGASAATLPLRMARSAGAGAAMGAIAGAGEGEGVADTIGRAASGAAIGGALGGAATPVVEGVIKGARALATPVVNAIRGVRDAEGEAARRAALALQRDMDLDPQAASRLSAQEFVDARQAGDPVNLMDVGGETTRALARSAANTSPEGRAVLSKAIDDRYEGQTPRVTSWLEKNFNYPDAAATQEAIETAAKTANRPAYAKAYAKGQALWDDGLDQLSQAPVVQQAIRLAFVTGRNRDALAGFPPIKNPFTLNRETGRFELADGATPNLQFWDHVKRNLDKLGAEGQAFSKALRGHLDQLVPEYQTARSGAAAFFGAEDALDAGRKIVTSRMNNSEIARGLSKMTPEERKLAQDGFVSDYIAMLRETGDRRNVLNKIAESPAARQRLEMVLGPQKAKELEVMLRVEGIMDAARPAVQGNSTTARQLAELGLAGGTYTVGTGGDVMNPNPTALANAALVYGAAKGRSKINENVSRKVAELLASNDPAALLKGIRIVANNNQLFNSLRSADKGLARIGGQQAGGIQALQAAGIGRAEDQPDVPRPPGQ